MGKLLSKKERAKRQFTYFDEAAGHYKTICTPEETPASTWKKDQAYESMMVRLGPAGQNFFKSFSESRS